MAAQTVDIADDTSKDTGFAGSVAVARSRLRIDVEIEHLRATDPDEYEHVYEGMCRQAVTGAIYRNELLAADKEGRICRVPYDASKPVDTFWDLGYFDNVAIWLAQSIGFEFRFIDFIQGSQQSLQYYLRELQSRGYVYCTNHRPWDRGTPSLQTGRSFGDHLIAGRRVGVAAQLNREISIRAARTIFGKCARFRQACASARGGGSKRGRAGTKGRPVGGGE